MIQQVESYVVTPIAQQKAVKLPPAVTIFAQVLLTITIGGIGLLLASPLAAVVLTLVRMLYVEDVLGDHDGDVGGQEAAQQPLDMTSE